MPKLLNLLYKITDKPEDFDLEEWRRQWAVEKAAIMKDFNSLSNKARADRWMATAEIRDSIKAVKKDFIQRDQSELNRIQEEFGALNYKIEHFSNYDPERHVKNFFAIVDRNIERLSKLPPASKPRIAPYTDTYDPPTLDRIANNPDVQQGFLIAGVFVAIAAVIVTVAVHVVKETISTIANFFGIGRKTSAPRQTQVEQRREINTPGMEAQAVAPQVSNTPVMEAQVVEAQVVAPVAVEDMVVAEVVMEPPIEDENQNLLIKMKTTLQQAGIENDSTLVDKLSKNFMDSIGHLQTRIEGIDDDNNNKAIVASIKKDIIKLETAWDEIKNKMADAIPLCDAITKYLALNKQLNINDNDKIKNKPGAFTIKYTSEVNLIRSEIEEISALNEDAKRSIRLR